MVQPVSPDSIITQNGPGTVITIGGGLTVSGTITGNGSGLTNLNASNIASGTHNDTRLSANVPSRVMPSTAQASWYNLTPAANYQPSVVLTSRTLTPATSPAVRLATHALKCQRHPPEQQAQWCQPVGANERKVVNFLYSVGEPHEP